MDEAELWRKAEEIAGRQRASEREQERESRTQREKVAPRLLFQVLGFLQTYLFFLEFPAMPLKLFPIQIPRDILFSSPFLHLKHAPFTITDGLM